MSKARTDQDKRIIPPQVGTAKRRVLRKDPRMGTPQIVLQPPRRSWPWRWQRVPQVLAIVCLVALMLGPLERFWWPLEIVANSTAWIICGLMGLFAIGDRYTRFLVSIAALVGLLISLQGMHGSVAFLEAMIVSIGVASMVNRVWMRMICLCLPFGLLVFQPVGLFQDDGGFLLLIQDLDTNNTDPTLTIDQIAAAAPDVIVLTAFDIRQRDRIRSLGYGYDIEDTAPEGPAIFSRLPFMGSQDFKPLGKDSVGAVGARLQTASGPVTVFGLHAVSPYSALGRAERDRYLQQIHAWMALNPGPAVVAGDLNLSPFGSAWGALDPNHTLAGFTPWWDVTAPVGTDDIGFALDHALTTEGLTSHPIQVLPRVGSEHRGLLIQIDPNTG